MAILEQVVAVTEAMESASGAARGILSTHGPFRLAALLAGDDIVFLEAASAVDAPPNDGEFIGRVVAMTANRVVVADFHPRSSASDPRQRVGARTWPRRALNRVQVNGTDEAWELAEASQPLPPGAQIALSFDSGDELLLPLDPQLKVARQRAWDFLPSLMADLVSVPPWGTSG